MDKQKQQLIITGVLVLVLAIVSISSFKPKKRRPPAVVDTAQPVKPNVPAAAARPAGASAVASAKDIDEQKKRANLEWGLDPFYHAVKTEIYQSSSFVLKGVSLGGASEGYVFVNDQILTVGDMIVGYKVIEVHKNKVLLKKGNEKFYLVLPEE